MTGAPSRVVEALRSLVTPDRFLLARILAAFVLVLALASLVTLLLETRLTREQLAEQALQLFAESGDVLEARISEEGARVTKTLSVLAQSRFAAPERSPSLTDVSRDAALSPAVETLSLARTAGGDLHLVGIVDGRTGEVTRGGLPARAAYAPLPEATATVLSRSAGPSQRVAPLVDGGYGMAYVQPVQRQGGAPLLLVAGYVLDRTYARTVLSQTGVDDVEIVVDGRVVASTVDGADPVRPSADPGRVRETQSLSDGRLVRYVRIGVDRPWDAPAAIGLISDDPLAALDAALTRTRMLMVALLVVLGGALAFGLARRMTRPIHELTSTATAIAGGDLERRFDVERSDEIGRLADALETMRRGLRAQLLVIRRQADALREATRRIVGVQDRERRRIAQDLHDGIQQQLVVLRMQVGALAARSEAHPREVATATRDLARTIDGLLDQLRSTGQELFPSILRDRGLGAAVFSLAGRTEVPLEIRLHPDPLPRLDEAVEVGGYFLVSEAVSNALKHARASLIVVEIVQDGHQLRIRVTDDGVGFDREAEGHRGGLVHLHDRVNALGGSLRLATDPGRGTSITAVLPCGAGAAGSGGGALQVEEDGGDPPVQVELFDEAELAEDGVDVLLDGSFRDRQIPRDGGVAPS